MPKEPWYFTRQRLLSNLSFIRGDVLDVGAGTQKYKSILLGACRRYWATDAYQSGVDVCSDIARLPFLNDSFDTLVCTSVLEHLPQPWLALQEMHRVLKPTGHLFLTAPWLYPYHQSPKDYYRFSRDALRFLLQSQGFDILKLESYGGFQVFLIEYVNQTWANGGIKKAFLKLAQPLAALLERQDPTRLNTPNHMVVARKPAAEKIIA